MLTRVLITTVACLTLPVANAPAALVDGQAAEILKGAGVQGGLIVHVECGDGRLLVLSAGDGKVVCLSSGR